MWNKNPDSLNEIAPETYWLQLIEPQNWKLLKKYVYWQMHSHKVCWKSTDLKPDQYDVHVMMDFLYEARNSM